MPDPFKLLLDENVPYSIRPWILERWPTWKIEHVRDLGLKSKSDSQIFKWAQENEFAILTFDEDFADRRSFAVGRHFGIIRMRFWPTLPENIHKSLVFLFNSIPTKEISGSLIILSTSKMRIRKYPEL